MKEIPRFKKMALLSTVYTLHDTMYVLVGRYIVRLAYKEPIGVFGVPLYALGAGILKT